MQGGVFAKRIFFPLRPAGRLVAVFLRGMALLLRFNLVPAYVVFAAPGGMYAADIWNERAAAIVLPRKVDQSWPTGGFGGIETREAAIMVGVSNDLWLQCRIEQSADLPLMPPGFCARLAAEVTRMSGKVVRCGEGAALGAAVLDVTVGAVTANRANAVIQVGIQSADGLTVTDRQELRISTVDGTLSAASATVLVYPLLKMLGKGD